MFDEVPEPVWKVSIGNWSSWRPSTTSCAARDDRRRRSRRSSTPELRVHRGRRGLDRGQRPDRGPVPARARRSGSSPPPAASAPATARRRDPDLAHRVVLDAVVAHGSILPCPRSTSAAAGASDRDRRDAVPGAGGNALRRRCCGAGGLSRRTLPRSTTSAAGGRRDRDARVELAEVELVPVALGELDAGTARR